MAQAQVQVEETGTKGLQREFNVKVPSKDVEKKYVARLEQIGRTVRLPGFRPGKIPLQVLQQRFGPGTRTEVLDRVISETAQKALNDRKLRPAAEPKIELVSFAEGQDLEFKLAIEVMPEFAPADFGKIALERLTADVADKAVEDAIGRIVKAVRQPEIVAEKHAAKMGDVVVLDFDGSVDGKREPGMKGENHSLELGSKSFIDNFEQQLVGLKAGDKKTVKVKFPAEYHAPNLAGKDAVFEVEIKELRAQKPVVMNDDLAMELGLKTMDELKKRVAEDIKGDYDRISRAVIKRGLMDKLAALHSFEVPAGMLESEFEGIWQQVEESKKRGALPAAEAKKSDEQLKKDYRAIAESRVRLGLLLSEVARLNSIAVSSTELRNAMIAEAKRFPGQEKAVVDYYTNTQGALERLRAPLLEEKVVDHILGKAKLTERKIPADELVKMPEEMEDD